MAYQPKSYRKFVATAATATLVASAIAPVAGAASNFEDVAPKYKDAVDYLVANGITSGKTATTFGTHEDIKRGDLAIWLAAALKLDTAGAAPSGFEDTKGTRYDAAVSVLKSKGYINGKTATTFAPSAPVTRGEMAIMLSNAYDLKSDVATKFTDAVGNYKTAIQGLYAYGVTTGASDTAFGTNANIKRGDLAIFLKRAAEVVKESKVVSVSSPNAKEIKVQFSTPVNADTLKDSAKNNVITVVAGKDANNAGLVTQELSADGMTLTLKATTFFKGDYTVKVPFEIVKDVKGNYVKPVNQKLTVSDTAAPALSSATSKIKDVKDGIKSITLTFDEEVSSIDTVKIGTSNYNPSISGNTATIVVDLDASKTYDVSVINATDAAGNIKDVQVAPLSVSVDNLAPAVVGVEATGENTVKVTLDKELQGDVLAITGKVGSFATNIVKTATVNPKNKKEYTVTLDSNYLFKGGNSDTVTLTVAKEALVDKLGNKNSAEIVKTVVVSKDVTVPTVSNVTTAATNGKTTSFTVTYNEEVQTLDTNKVSVVNSKGEILAFSNVVSGAAISSTDAKKVVYTLKSDLKVDKYSFVFEEGLVVDKSLSKNKSAKYSTVVDVTDVTKPVDTTFNIAGATENNNVITVDFGQKVKATGTGSALNPAAYQVNGTALPADTKIEFDTSSGSLDQSIVVITLPKGFVKVSDTKAVFRVTGVQTLDNKVSNSFIATVDITDNAAPEVKSFVATDLTKLTVTYSEAVEVATTTEDLSDEIKLFDSKGASVAISSYEVKDGKLVLTVSDATTVTKLTTVETTDVDVVDAAGNAQKHGLTVNK